MKVRLFLTVMLFCATANAQQAITPEVLSQLEKGGDTTPAERALRNAIQSNSINKMAKTKVSTTAVNKIPFFLFMILCLLLCLT